MLSICFLLSSTQASAMLRRCRAPLFAQASKAFISNYRVECWYASTWQNGGLTLKNGSEAAERVPVNLTNLDERTVRWLCQMCMKDLDNVDRSVIYKEALGQSKIYVQTGHGAFAGEDMEEGAFIAEWTGSESCCINYGDDTQSNIAAVPVFGDDGKLHVCFFALRKISKDEQLLWNYGLMVTTELAPFLL